MRWSNWMRMSGASATAPNFCYACWQRLARRKISGRNNGGLCKNEAIDELAREAAAAGTAVKIFRMATAETAVWQEGGEENRAPVDLQEAASANGRMAGKAEAS